MNREQIAYDRWLTTEPEHDRCAVCGQTEECDDACVCVECEIDREHAEPKRVPAPAPCPTCVAGYPCATHSNKEN